MVNVYDQQNKTRDSRYKKMNRYSVIHFTNTKSS